MPATDPAILLVDPTRTGNGHEYKAAVHDFGFEVVSLFTGESPTASRLLAHPDKETSLWVNSVEDALSQIGAAGLDLHAVVPAYGVSVHMADKIAARLSLPGNDETLAWARRNKGAMRVRAMQTGILVPEFRRVHSLDKIMEAAQTVGFPVIVKQTMGWGSFGVSVVSDAAALHKACTVLSVDMFGRPVSEWLVERYVRGREYAVNFFSADGAHRMVDAWEYRQPDSRDYDFPLWDIIQISADHHDYVRVERFVQAALDAFGIRWGPSHIEVKCSDKGDDVFLIELAPRFSGGPAVPMWTRHSDLRPFHDAVECYLGRRPRVIDGDHGFTAVLGSVVIRNDDAPGALVAVHGLAELVAMPGVADVFVGFKPGEHVPVTREARTIPVSASVHGPDSATVLRTMTLARQTVKLEIAPQTAGSRDEREGTFG